MTAAGYPGRYRQSDVISGLPTHDEELGDEVKLFHAGTQEAKDGQVVTHGGWVLCATALGATVAEAQSRAYDLAKRVHWDGVYYRTDIGYRAIARERGE
jgi:phosphoribosylamine--glycine ligase